MAQKLVDKVKALDATAARKVASFLGAVVADAACLHLEWIYDQDKVSKIVPSGEEPAFWKESCNPFFSLPNGKVSCYADEAVQSLIAMDKNERQFDAAKVIQQFHEHFGAADSPYQVALAKRKDKKYPIEGPWIQGAMISMMDRAKAGMNPPGPDDAREHDGLATALPLIVQMGSAYDESKLKNAFEIMTQDPFAIEHHQAEAFLIGKFIEGSTADPLEATKEKFPSISEEISIVQKEKSEGATPQALVKKFGMACPMPGSFQSSLVSIIGADSYADAIRETMLCGGDCCSRSVLIGACLGAKFGIDGIPTEWLNKVENMDDLFERSIRCFS